MLPRSSVTLIRSYYSTSPSLDTLRNQFNLFLFKSLSSLLLCQSFCTTSLCNQTYRMSSNYSVIHRGQPNTQSYRLFLSNGGTPISPFHDIPMFADQANKVYNMVVEVPRWSNAKMEIATKEGLNPIKQDVKKDALRFVKNIFPHHGYIWNYGAIPQTWEDPNHLDESTKCRGDNDPIDVCEIGERVHERGAVVQVKILGVFGLIDEGETDWKLMAIDVNDPLASKLNDIGDIEKHKGGLLKATHEWFQWYKVPDGKPQNKFAFDGKPKDRQFAENIIASTHEYWKKLITSPPDATVNTSGLDCRCVTVTDCPYKVDNSQAIVDSSPAPSEPKEITVEEQQAIDKWYHVV